MSLACEVSFSDSEASQANNDKHGYNDRTQFFLALRMTKDKFVLTSALQCRQNTCERCALGCGKIFVGLALRQYKYGYNGYA